MTQQSAVEIQYLIWFHVCLSYFNIHVTVIHTNIQHFKGCRILYYKGHIKPVAMDHEKSPWTYHCTMCNICQLRIVLKIS